jgi:hypothetical protein
VIDSFLASAKSWTLCVLAFCCIGLAAGTVYMERYIPAAGVPDVELMYFPSGRFLEQASLGHEMLVADFAWLRALQYYGRHRRTDQDYTMAGHIFDVVTTLDPKFMNAYVFGGLVLAQDAGDVESGVDLLHKGMVNLPDEWMLPFEAGFIYYICAADVAQAYRWFMEAAEKPGHPESVERFAAFCAKRTGDLQTALGLWVQLYESSENSYVKEMAQARINAILKEIGEASSNPSRGGTSDEDGRGSERGS